MNKIRIFGVIIAGLVFILGNCDSGSGPTGDDTPLIPSWDSVEYSGDVEAFTSRMLYPNGGETFKVDQTVNVVVGCKPGDEWFVVVEVSFDNGMSWHNISGDEQVELRGGNKVVKWIIPAQIEVAGEDNISVVTNTCRIRVVEYQFDENYDEADATFSIIP